MIPKIIAWTDPIAQYAIHQNKKEYPESAYNTIICIGKHNPNAGIHLLSWKNHLKLSAYKAWK